MRDRPEPDMDIAATFDHEPFRHTDEKYKCLCNRMHCKQGCRYIFIFLIVVIVVGLILLAVNYNHGTWATFILHSVILVGIGLCAATLFLAMKTEKEKMLLPVVGLAVLGAVVALIFFFFCIWTLFDPVGESGKIVNNFVMTHNNTLQKDYGLEENRDDIQTVSAFGVVLSLLGLAASIWVAFVVYKYYMYLRDMKRARNPKTQVVQVNREVTALKKRLHAIMIPH
ncbi:unnamed protein product [Caenorhabditis auriculariae]|uniref:Uncharacterized protein n=1 Tax=Caenorhabditis auriculariae TaxID=2777116 RepID=A0A8S1GW45_9PELO|nr:unnamed protein product [Caenorhabditis auriculariae]